MGGKAPPPEPDEPEKTTKSPPPAGGPHERRGPWKSQGHPSRRGGPAGPYADWAPLFGAAPEAQRQGALQASMDGLRELLRLWSGGETAVGEQLLATVADYLGLGARLFALEDKREALELDGRIAEAGPSGPTSRPSLRPSSTTTRPTSRSSAITCFIIRYPPRS